MSSSTSSAPPTQLVTEVAERGGGRPQAPAQAESMAAPPRRIADRYVVEGELGRGGLAVVYRVLDSATGRSLALKQLALPTSHAQFSEQSAAFEREFHTLVQLAHPRIIEVYDFGLDERGRYYTMELLDGRDLRERSPMPWRDACSITYDVCSSLALLHSRGLVHRDVSPRNVRSGLDGAAKLIDFGALVPMGRSAQIVGTPQFVAPEVLHRSALDGRADLFSLGATLYFVLTGRFAYTARSFSDLRQAWNVRPLAPSAMAPDVPAALDALVLSLISLDPAARPRSAFEVMQRLASIAGLERGEDAGVPQAYLSAPVLVGREAALSTVRARVERARAGEGSSVLVDGVAGAGRSRLLDECALVAKLAGVMVLRVNAGLHGDDVLAVGRSLAGQIVEAAPELATEAASRPLPANVADRSAHQAALSDWLQRVARSRPLAILVDDAHTVDPASLALLATLALSAPRLKLLLITSRERGLPLPASDALAVLERESAVLELPALDHDQVEALVGSLFGDVPNLALVSERLFRAALGNPRETLDLVQALIARGTIRYEGGRWLLPGRLQASELATSSRETCRRVASELSVLARTLAELNALASHPTLGRNDYALALPEVSSARLDEAISELLAQRVLTDDHLRYGLSRREWGEALIARLDDETKRARHRELAAIYAKDERHALERADHLLAAGEETSALDLLLKLLFASSGDSQGLLSLTTMSAEQVASILDRGLTSAEKLGRSPRELNELRRGVFAVSIVTDEAHYLRAARPWFAQLEQDSGLALYRSLSEIEDPGQRLMRALTVTAERFAATPEHERVYSPEAAIKNLAYYVAVSIALGSRMQDAALIASLPAVLEPYAALSPLLHAIWQNSIATRETVCDNQPELGRRRWLEVLDALSKVSSTELSYVVALRRAILYGIGFNEARLGFATAEQTVRVLDEDPMQASSAMSLRRVARLHQGDFAGAERFRRRAEQIALHGNVRSMFASTVQAELIAYALASDLTGIRQAAEVIEPLAARFPGWLGYKHLADGCFEQARGQLDAALEALERGLQVADPAPRVAGQSCGAWPRLVAACIEVLVGLERSAEAKRLGERALATCAEHRIEAAAISIQRALALAEAKLGDYAGASSRLQSAIGDLIALGVTGLELGATYEARARIAIWFADQEAVVEYGRHAAREYRYGEGSSLGARYERLMDEARRDGQAPLPELHELQSRLMTSGMRRAPSATAVEDKLAGAVSPQERLERLLRLVCELRGGHSGHLYVKTETGFLHVASIGGGLPEPALDAFVSHHVSQRLETSELATAIGGGEGQQPTSTSCVDATGATYHPLLLMAEADHSKVCAGVAMIATEAFAPFTEDAQQVLDAAAEVLLQLG